MTSEICYNLSRAVAIKTVATNRKAYHRYHLEDSTEAGIVLTGTEIKSIRAGRVNLGDAYIRPEAGELWLVNAHIARYEPSSYLSHDPTRPRKLLLHRKQIDNLTSRVLEKGFTLVITSPDGKTVFYTGDTGPGLADCWEWVSPQLLIIEVTTPDRYQEFATRAGHLTPNLLKQELNSFLEIKGYLPPVIVVHMNPGLEKEIEAEIAAIASALNSPITLAYEGMKLHL